MNYQETLDFLYQQLPMFQEIGHKAYKKDLTNIIAFCKYLDNPQQHFKTIHIAGTNGKGSTTHMLGAIFQAQGLKVGLYTSPHYKDFRERIKINGEYISEEAVVNFVAENKDFIHDLQPSYFEMTVALAFQYFKEEKVDIAMIETGMGGRLDSTNIITPLLSVITNISLDHTKILGETIPLIAVEKAGIIKEAIPVVIGESQPETTAVFIEKATATNSPITFADQQLSAQIVETQFHQTVFNVYNAKQQLVFERLELGLFGNYQSKNLITVLSAIQTINDAYGFNITKDQILTGLKHIKNLTKIMGRWEVIHDSPLVLADSAHNPSGIKYAMEQIFSLKFSQLHIVMGVVNDKDLTNMLSLFPNSAKYYFSKPNIPRGLNAIDLQAQAKSFDLHGQIYASIPMALEAALSMAQSDDLVFVGGSTFTVAEIV
jgi:dihydrofolate synthase / folylpolyglutamate synthase